VSTCDTQIFNKPKISTGKKIDVTMDKVRVGLFFKDPEAVKDNLERAKKLVEDVRHARFDTCMHACMHDSHTM
jgi:hypothetical protein